MTPSQTVGPFFHMGLTANSSRACLCAPDAPGERIRLRVRVTDGAGASVSDGMVELWQAEIGGFGRLETDADGCCAFETVKPAGHINVAVFARGLLAHLCTRIYFGAAEDEVLALVPENRRGTLFARECGPGEWQFEIRLQGEGETVFFDV
jgi:protocatechuate 3,4-dioxygenase alpha subunit